MKETDLDNNEILLIDGHAHCDGPCGVYDPASARVAAEAVQSMTKKMNTLESNHGDSGGNSASYINTMSRYAAIKEDCLLYTSPSPRDQRGSRMPSSA